MRDALVLLLAVGGMLSTPAAAQAATAAKPPGELRVCSEGALTDVFVDRGELHKEKRNLPPGKCKSFALPKGKYAITVLGHCENNRDSKLTDIAVAPESRALYTGEYLAGARVVRESTTTFTVTWDCTGIGPNPGESGPPAFGEPTPPPAAP